MGNFIIKIKYIIKSHFVRKYLNNMAFFICHKFVILSRSPQGIVAERFLNVTNF